MTDRVEFSYGFLRDKVISPIASSSTKAFSGAGSFHRSRPFKRKLFGLPGRLTDRVHFSYSFLGCRVVRPIVFISVTAFRRAGSFHRSRRVQLRLFGMPGRLAAPANSCPSFLLHIHFTHPDSQLYTPTPHALMKNQTYYILGIYHTQLPCLLSWLAGWE